MKIRSLASIALIGIAGCTTVSRSPLADEVAREYAQAPARPRVAISTRCFPDPSPADGVTCVDVVEVEY